MDSLLKQEKDSKFEDVYALAEMSMGFLPNSMLYMSSFPSLLLNFSIMSKIILKQKLKISIFTKVKIFFRLAISIIQREKEVDTIGPDLRWLVAYVASNAAGCNYCKAHTAHSAARSGINQKKIDDAFIFEESDIFSEKEKAALALALAGGVTPNRVTNDHILRIKNYFTDKEIIEVISVISFFGFLNRWNDTLKTPLESLFYK